KNTLSLLFMLLSVLLYFHPHAPAMPAERNRQKRRKAQVTPASEGGIRFDSVYWFAVGVFALAMLSKGSVATLPILLLLLTYWQHGRISRRDVLAIVPFVVIAAALTFVNIALQSRSAGGEIRHVTVVQRGLGAGAVVWFYLYKALLP